MTDSDASLILEYMRRFEKTLADMRADMHDMREEMRAINRRVSRLGEGLALINRRADRLDCRIARIEKRLDLVES